LIALCQWIEGEPSEDDRCKCGAPAADGRSYCAAHEARAYLLVEQAVGCAIPVAAPRAAGLRLARP
jgi:hypothetical protein